MWRLRNFMARAGATRGVRPLAYVAFLGLAVTLTGAVVHSLFRHLVMAPASPLMAALRVEQQNVPRSTTASHVTLTQDEWHERIKERDFWRERSPRPAAVSRPDTRPGALFPLRDGYEPLFDSPVRRPGDGTFRTVCVRLCDGFYFPISFSTTESNFGRDQATCENRCGAPARLYVAPSSSDDAADLRSLDGQPYTKLPTALLYRTKYDAQCRCTPQPWDKEALDRHRIYALEEAQRRGNREAREELAAFKRQLEADRRRSAQQRALVLASLKSGSVLARSGLTTDPAVASVNAPVKSTPAARTDVRLVAGATPLAPETTIMRLGVMPQKSNANMPVDEPTTKERSRNKRFR